MKVLFIDENTLGHGSYLPVFADYFARHPELGIEPELLHATPLPEEVARTAEWTAPGLRRFGLDLHFARWRNLASAHVRALVKARNLDGFGAIVVNTQSVALNLGDLPLPLFVCLDATFRQLSASKWFSNPPLGAVGTTLNAGLIKSERALFAAAEGILPWSQLAAQSVRDDYGIASEKICVIPPSMEMPMPSEGKANRIPKALFIGGDFKRKGGDILVETQRNFFRGWLELEIITQTGEAPKQISRGSAAWKDLWRNADLFIFPSRLETFGIVLVEAMAFGVPIISSRAGAAEEILANGECGLLLNEPTVKKLAAAIVTVLEDFPAAQARAALGRQRAERDYDLGKNAERLAGLLKGARS